MKIVVGIIFIILSTYIGYILSENKKSIYSFYNSFYNFNNNLINQVSYSNRTINDIIRSDKKGDLFIKYLSAKLIKKENIENKKLQNIDIEFVNDYIFNLGKNDSISQKKYLENIKNEILIKKKQSEDKYKICKKMYVKLGFFIGLIIFVIIL